jgi:endonuclease-3
MTRLQAEFILTSLKRELPIDETKFTILKGEDPFELLIATVLSQNTSDRNSMKALKILKEKVGVDQSSLLRANLADIEAAIKVGGLYHNKARTIKSLASKFHGFNWSSMDNMTQKDLREFLLGLPGIGPKTADIFLLFYAKLGAFPVDTHISRVSKRLGIAHDGDGYEETTDALKRFFSPGDYRLAHLELIALGRRFCRARYPLCDECPLRGVCPSAFKLSKHHRARLSRH